MRPRWWTHFGQLTDPAQYWTEERRYSDLNEGGTKQAAGCQIMNNVPRNRSHSDVPDQVSVISLRVSIVKSSVPCLGWGLPGLSQNFDLKISHFCGRVGGRTLASCQTLPLRS